MNSFLAFTQLTIFTMMIIFILTWLILFFINKNHQSTKISEALTINNCCLYFLLIISNTIVISKFYIYPEEYLKNPNINNSFYIWLIRITIVCTLMAVWFLFVELKSSKKDRNNDNKCK